MMDDTVRWTTVCGGGGKVMNEHGVLSVCKSVDRLLSILRLSCNVVCISLAATQLHAEVNGLFTNPIHSVPANDPPFLIYRPHHLSVRKATTRVSLSVCLFVCFLFASTLYFEPMTFEL